MVIKPSSKYRSNFLFYFVVPWLNAMLTSLSTSSVYIETLNNEHWELPTGKWYVDRDSRRICSFRDDAPLKGCTDQQAGSDNYYWVGNGEMSRGDSIRTLSQNRKRGFSLTFSKICATLGLRIKLLIHNEKMLLIIHVNILRYFNRPEFYCSGENYQLDK